MPAAALAYGNLYGARGQRQRFGVHQRVVEHDVGALQQPRRAQREQVRRAGPGADEIDLAGHWIIPAATVWLVDFVDQDERAGGAVVPVGVAADRLVERQRHVDDVVHRRSPPGAGSCSSVWMSTR